MSIEFACPTCSGTLRVGDESAGRVIRCGACMATLRVPGTAAEPPAAPPPAPTDPAHEPPAAPRSPFETGADPDAPAAAIPVARPRAKMRDYDDRDREYDPDRPRRRRRGPPPRSPGRSALFWLGLVGGLFLLIIGGCCGGLYLAVPDAKWQKHESAKGGFKVDLPAPARKDMDKMAGGVPDPNAPMEGTILFRRLQEYVVVYRDLPPHERGGATDKALMDAAVDGMKSSGEVDAVLSQKDIVVNGFPGREVEFSGREGGHYTARVIIADGRLYMLVAGGKLADRNEPNVRRFLDSFEITDPKLKTAAQKKADENRKQAEARERAEAEQARAREMADVREVGELAARQALDAGTAAHEAVVEFRRGVYRAGATAGGTSLDAGTAEGQAVLDAVEALRRGAEVTAGTVVDFGDRESRKVAFFSSDRSTGVAPPPATAGKLVFHLTFDGSSDRPATAPNGKALALPPGAEYGPGVRGTALYLPPGTKLDLDALPDIDAPGGSYPLTITAWVKTTAAQVEAFRFYTDVKRSTGYSMWLTNDYVSAMAMGFPLKNEVPQEALREYHTTKSVSDGRWHHVAVTRRVLMNGGEETAFYVDGRQVSRRTIFRADEMNKTLKAASVGALLKARPEAADDVPNFAIDDLCVFTEALNETAIRRLARFEPLPVAPAPRLVNPQPR